MLSSAASELTQLETQLGRALGRCIAEHNLIEHGDRVMVCMSGGKDSYTMLTLLERFQRRAPFPFELIAVHLDQAQPGYDGTKLREWLAAQAVPYRILREDTYSVVVSNVKEGKTYCSLCSRLRRGVLYNAACDLGCSKIALGHHRDDAIETLMLNLLYTGSLASMPPKLQSRDRRNIVIRPLLYAREPQIARYAELMRFPILPCDLCGSQEQLKRKQVKRVLAELEQVAPNARDSMLAAMGNVKAAHLLDMQLLSALGVSMPQAGEADPEIAPARPAQSAPVGAEDGTVVQPARVSGDGTHGRRLPLVR
jgi:tRNA 2-thiocytidine biosynthesis protein TtcA